MNSKVLSKLQNLCSRREYCSSDIYKKALVSLDGNVVEAEEMLESLKKDGYVDDLRYASAFSREKAHISGWGPVKISYALRMKGIDKQTIDAALREIDADKSDDKLLKLMQSKYKTLQGDPQWKLKLIRFALGRGYDYDSVSKFLSEL